MGRFDYYKKGSWNIMCMRCNFKTKIEHIKREWTGLLVCDETVNNCWEPRHPQDLLHSIPDKQSVNPVYPELVPRELQDPPYDPNTGDADS